MTPPQTENWKQVVARFQQPSAPRALWQLANSVMPYLGLWCLMYFSVQVSWWLTLPLAVLAAGFLVRIFIIFHDCGHGSFFRSRRANDITGFFTGDADFNLPPVEGEIKTTRQQVEAHTESKEYCASCHKTFVNPPGFVGWTMKHGFKSAPPIANLLMRAATVSINPNQHRSITDILIAPELTGVELRDWKKYDATVQEGYDSMKQALADVRGPLAQIIQRNVIASAD